MKICTACNTELPLDAFNKNKARKDGLQSLCRECWKVYYRETYYKSGKEKDRLKEKAGREREAIRAFVKDAKNVPCLDCGMRYPPYVMQFDHVRGDKFFNIGSAARSQTLSKVVREAAKCEIVCANCHAERTYSRIGT